MKDNLKGDTNTTIETTAEDKTLISAWDFLPRPIIETLAKAGVIHLNDFILLDRLSIWPLPLSDNEKGIVLRQRDLLLANYDKSFVPFPFLFGDSSSSYSSLFSLMTIQQRLMLKERNGEASIADRISRATIDVIFSMFHSAGFYAEKGVFSTSARPSVEMAKKDGMIRLWDAGLDDISAFSNALADKDARTVFDMVHAIFVGYRLSLDSLKVPVVETWYHYFPEPFMHNLYAVAENPDDADVRRKAEQDVRTHIIDLKCYQFALRIRELDIYSHTPLPTFSNKPIYDTSQLNFVKALKDFDARHPDSIRAFGVAIEEIRNSKTDSPLAFQTDQGIDICEFVLKALDMPAFVRFKNPITGLPGYDGIDAQEPSPWHEPLRVKLRGELHAYFRSRARDAAKGGSARRFWLNAEAELIAYETVYLSHTGEEGFDAGQKVVNAANAAAREEWIEQRNEWVDREDLPFITADQLNLPPDVKSSIIYSRSTPNCEFLTPYQVAGYCAEILKQSSPNEGNSSFSLIVGALGKIDTPKPDESTVRELAQIGVPEVIRHIDEGFAKLVRGGKDQKKLLKQIARTVDPNYPYHGVDKAGNLQRETQIRAAIKYSWEENFAVAKPKSKAENSGKNTFNSLARVVWGLNPNWSFAADGYPNEIAFARGLEGQYNRNPASFRMLPEDEED